MTAPEKLKPTNPVEPVQIINSDPKFAAHALAQNPDISAVNPQELGISADRAKAIENLPTDNRQAVLATLVVDRLAQRD